MKPDCNTCERRDKKHADDCTVFETKPDDCWAWTDDPDWHIKVAVAVKRYRDGTWRDALEG